MNRRKAGWIAGLAVVGLVLSACSSSSESSAPTSAEPAPAAPSSAAPASSAAPQQFTIALSNLGLNFPFPVAISKGQRDKAEELGMTVITETDAQGSVDQQTTDIQDIIAQKPDAVVVMPVDSEAAVKWVDDLTAAGIAVVSVGEKVGSADSTAVYEKLVAVANQDEVAAGRTAGEIALAALPEGGKVAIVEGAPGFAANQLRVKDFTAPATEAGVTFEVVASQPGGWVPDEAEKACQNMLQADPEIKLFYNLSDDMAVGCAKAVKAAGSKALVVGIGGSKLGVDAVTSGEIYGTVCYKPEDMGQLSVQALYDYLTGANPEMARMVTYETPGITKDNVSECVAQW